MTKQARIFKEVWIPSDLQFTFKEQIDPHSGDGKFILKGMILPFGKISRNNVLYNKESIQQIHKQLVGRPVMYNHKIDDTLLPVGHFVGSECKDDGWYYEADIDPEEKDLIRKLKRGDLRHTSIQVIGGKVVERSNQAGEIYTEAFVSDVIEGSIVPAPGFLDTTANFIEALKRNPDSKLAEKLDYAKISDAPLNKVKHKLQQKANELMRMDSKLWDDMGVDSGTALEKRWEEYKSAIKQKVMQRQNPFIYLILEDQNYHALNKALDELDLWDDPEKYVRLFEFLREALGEPYKQYDGMGKPERSDLLKKIGIDLASLDIGAPFRDLSREVQKRIAKWFYFHSGEKAPKLSEEEYEESLAEEYTVEQDGKEVGKISNISKIQDAPWFDMFATHTVVYDDSGEIVFDSDEESLSEVIASDFSAEPAEYKVQVKDLKQDAVKEYIERYHFKENDYLYMTEQEYESLRCIRKESDQNIFPAGKLDTIQKREDVSTSTADGAIAPTQPLDKKKEATELPIYKIKGKFYFRDERLGEYRNIKNPSDKIPIDEVPNDMLEKPTEADRKKVWGEGVTEQDELYRFIDNDADLNRQRREPIEKNLTKKWKAGTYNHDLAIKLWMYLVDDGAKKYAKDNSQPQDWNKIFSVSDRQAVAKMLADYYEQEAKLGNYEKLQCESLSHLSVRKDYLSVTGSGKDLFELEGEAQKKLGIPKDSVENGTVGHHVADQHLSKGNPYTIHFNLYGSGKRKIDEIIAKAKSAGLDVEMVEGLAQDKGITEKDVDAEQLAMGIEVEKEHTDDPEIAKMIALDHLAEIPDYYTRLKKMEDEAEPTPAKDEVEMAETEVGSNPKKIENYLRRRGYSPKAVKIGVERFMAKA